MTVTRGGQAVSQTTLRSGSMTADEAALGFPRSTLATYTENRAMRSSGLQQGDDILIQGQYPPCSSCKGSMNTRVREQSGSVTYTWPDGVWRAGQ